MPITDVEVVRSCRVCGSEFETIKVKKDNMRLFSDELVWCETCGAERPEDRDIAGRRESVEREQASYPQLRPAR